MKQKICLSLILFVVMLLTACGSSEAPAVAGQSSSSASTSSGGSISPENIAHLELAASFPVDVQGYSWSAANNLLAILYATTVTDGNTTTYTQFVRVLRDPTRWESGEDIYVTGMDSFHILSTIQFNRTGDKLLIVGDGGIVAWDAATGATSVFLEIGLLTAEQTFQISSDFTYLLYADSDSVIYGNQKLRGYFPRLITLNQRDLDCKVGHIVCEGVVDFDDFNVAMFLANSQWEINNGYSDNIDLVTTNSSYTFSPNEDFIVTQRGEYIVLWNIASQSMEKVLFDGETAWYNMTLRPVFSPSQRYIAFTTQNNTEIWDLIEDQLSLNSSVNTAFAFSPDESIFAGLTGYFPSGISFYDIRSVNEGLQGEDCWTGDDCADDLMSHYVTEDGEYRVCEEITNDCETIENEFYDADEYPFANTFDLSFSPDGAYFLVWSDKGIQIWAID